MALETPYGLWYIEYKEGHLLVTDAPRGTTNRRLARFIKYKIAA